MSKRPFNVLHGSSLALSRRSILATGVALAGSIMMPSLSRAAATMDKFAKDGIVRVGVANERPFGYIDTDGKLMGAVPEIISAILEPHGVKELQANVVEFGALIPGLNAGRFDVIGAGMYIRPARCEAVLFTDPVIRNGAGFVAIKGNPKGVKSVAEVAANSEILVGTGSGSANVEDLTKAGVPNDRIVLFSNATEALAGLKAGRCDIIYFPSLELNEVLKASGDSSVEKVANFEQIRNAKGDPDYGYSALGLRMDDTDFKKVFDDGVKKIINSGKLLEIISKYGYGKEELPDGVITAAEICKA